MRFCLNNLLARLIGLAALTAALGYSSTLTIVPIFDSTISNDSNAAAIESGINTAIQTFENTYTNPITATIYFQEGSSLGASNDVVYNVPYTQFYNDLVATDANPAAIAGLNANGGDADTNGGINPAGNTTGIEVKAPNGRAVGLDLPPGCYVTSTGAGDANGNIPNTCALSGSGAAVDGIVSLDTAITDPPNSPASSYYSLVSVAEHEIDEVLGLGSALENCNDTTPSGVCRPGSTLTLANDTPTGESSPEDLFRWSAPTGGVRTTSVTCGGTASAYFAYGATAGEIAQFNNSCNGADFGDWQSSPLPSGTSPHVQDAFVEVGSGAAYGQPEIDAMTAIGFTSVPEPSTRLTALSSVALLAWRLKRCQA